MHENHDIWDELELVTAGENLDEEMFELISAYADGEATPKERRLIEAYIAQSAEGRRLLADLRGGSAILAQAQRSEAPSWLEGAILDATTRRRIRLTLPAALRIAVPAAAAGLAVFLLRPSDVEPYVPGARIVDASAASPTDPGRVSVVPEASGRAGSEQLVAQANPAGETKGARRSLRPRATEADTRLAGGTLSPDPGAGSGGAALGGGRTAAPESAGALSAHSSPKVSLYGPTFGVTPKMAAEEPDPVALLASSEEREQRVVTSSKSDEPSPEARNRLREQLKKLNANQNELKEAVKKGA